MVIFNKELQTMALFNRDKKKKDVLPQEVREYYQAERRDRTGMAWLLAIATLIVTFLIAAGLFFGGRWLYRTVFDNNDNAGNTTSQSENGRNEQSGQQQQGANTGNEQNDDTPETATPGGPTEEGQTSSTNTATGGSSTGSVSGTSTTGGGTSGSTATPTTQPNTGATELVDTGAGDILGLFILVVIASAFAHHAVVTTRR
jgi:hypothetical protein